MLTTWRYQRTGNQSPLGGNSLNRFCPSPVAAYWPGASLPAGASVSRSTTATYVANVPDSVLVQLAGDSTSTATISRSTTATYITE